MEIPRAPRWSTAVVVVGAAIGLGLRIWALRSSLGIMDSDEAVKGLMVRHLLHGEISAFFWLQTYGGTQEVIVTAVPFALFGTSTLALKAVPVLFYAIAGVLLWRIGRRTVGEPAARLGAVLLWIAPAFFIWWSIKAYDYGFGLDCSLAVLLLALRLERRDSRRDAVALGLAAGLGWWATPLIVLVALPALAWLAWRRGRAFRLVPQALPAFLVGAAPWLAWNAKNGWLSLRLHPTTGVHTTYLSRLGDLFRFLLPTWLGVRVPYSLDWLVGRPLGIAVVALALAGFAVLLVRRPRPLEPLLAVLLAFPFLYALSPFGYFVDAPRYLVPIGGPIALLVAYPLRSARTALPVLAAALALCLAGLHVIDRDRLVVFGVPDVRAPRSFAPVLRLLEREGQTRVLANYWLAYRITYESRERVIATSTGFVRYVPHDRLVRSSPNPAHVFLRGSAEERRARRGLEQRGYRRQVVAQFVAYVHLTSRASPPAPRTAAGP